MRNAINLVVYYLSHGHTLFLLNAIEFINFLQMEITQKV